MCLHFMMSNQKERKRPCQNEWPIKIQGVASSGAHYGLPGAYDNCVSLGQIQEAGETWAQNKEAIGR